MEGWKGGRREGWKNVANCGKLWQIVATERQRRDMSIEKGRRHSRTPAECYVYIISHQRRALTYTAKDRNLTECGTKRGLPLILSFLIIPVRTILWMRTGKPSPYEPNILSASSALSAPSAIQTTSSPSILPFFHPSIPSFLSCPSCLS